MVDVPCRTGEGPLWHPDEACLYWMDIPNGHLFRYETRGGTFARVLEGPVLGAATLQRDGGIALCGIHGAVWTWRGELREVVPQIGGIRGTRFNDAIADPVGRILSGTMPTPATRSALWLIDLSGTTRRLVDDLGQSNGMAWSADASRLYHVDTHDAVLRVFDYDVDAGALAGGRVVMRFDGQGVPDGMAIDDDGCLWIALWGGGAVVRIDDMGRELARLAVPTPNVSSVAFGGDDLSDLYITTAGGDDRGRHDAVAGSLFVAREIARGLPLHRSDLRVATDGARPGE